MCSSVVKHGKLTSLQVLLKDKSGEQILQVSMVTQVSCSLPIFECAPCQVRHRPNSLRVQIELQSGIPIRHMLSPLD